jgi:lipopolysaccharide/colanic/teichoic acid biosynthesis glycosyltransferase
VLDSQARGAVMGPAGCDGDSGEIMLKRLFDLVAALLGLLVLSPLLLIIALAVRLSSRGHVLFRQSRVGRGGVDFILFKFRTMAVREGSERGSFDAGDTSRVTRIGRLLRATKLDELPQLWNVLRGEMSLVGPRPEVRKWVEIYPERWTRVHTVRPGITDPASILFRHEERILAESSDPERVYREQILPRKLGLYQQYVRTATFLKDLGILCWTARAVIGLGPTIHEDEGRRPITGRDKVYRQ